MCEHDFRFIAVHMDVCFNCGLQRDTNKYCLAESNYEFRPIRYPPYRRICRFAPLCDNLPQEDRSTILGMYHKILGRWKKFSDRRSKYFYNRGVMYSFLTSLFYKKPYKHVLQNRLSEEAQRVEMQYLLDNDPCPFVIPKPTGMDAIWLLFEQEIG